MDENEFVDWLKREELLASALKFYEYFVSILYNNLKANKEKIIIVGDLGSEGKRVPALCMACYYFAAKSENRDVELLIQDRKFRGNKADDKVVERFLHIQNKSIIILTMSGKLGSLKVIGKSFRKYVAQKDHKFISISGLNFVKTELFPSVVHSMKADPVRMQKHGEKIKALLDEAKEVQIKTDLGTDIRIRKDNTKSIINSGLYSVWGKGGNLPAGEVYFYPFGTTNVSGRVVIDGSIKTHAGTYVVRKNVELIISNGSIKEIKGGKEADLLRESLKWSAEKAKTPENVYKIAEIGIGINPNARVMGPTMIDEKTIGTAHIANGSNHWFGGPIAASVHFDHVFKHPKIYLDGKLLKV